MTLEVSCDGLWKLSIGLSQFHGQGSWLMCEVASRVELHHRVKRIKVKVSMVDQIHLTAR